MKRCISKSYTKTEQNGGCSSVNYYKCVPLFHSLKFPLHNYFVYSVAKKQNRTFAFLSSLDYDQDGIAGGSSEINLEVQWNLGITKDQETGRICSLYNEVSFYGVSFPWANYKENR